MMKADALLANAPGKAFIADAGYDSNRFRQAIRDKKKRALIGSKPERPRKLPNLASCTASAISSNAFTSIDGWGSSQSTLG
jgi:IS5 family transposase